MSQGALFRRGPPSAPDGPTAIGRAAAARTMVERGPEACTHG